jgi:hypothetical protein
MGVHDIVGPHIFTLAAGCKTYNNLNTEAPALIQHLEGLCIIRPGS